MCGCGTTGQATDKPIPRRVWLVPRMHFKCGHIVDGLTVMPQCPWCNAPFDHIENDDDAAKKLLRGSWGWADAS